MATTYNITCDAGATFLLPIIWKDVTGAPVNLASFTAFMDIRSTAGVLLLALTSANGRVLLGDSAGVITLYITATDTTGLTAATYNYDLFLHAPSSGPVTKLLSGTFTVNAHITATP